MWTRTPSIWIYRRSCVVRLTEELLQTAVRPRFSARGGERSHDLVSESESGSTALALSRL